MFKTIIVSNLENLVATKPANAAQRKWMSDISKFIEVNGLHILYGSDYLGRTDFQLHHVLGRSAKHNKVAIGHWFVIPVPIELHDISSNHPLNVTHHKHKFTDEFGLQSHVFHKMYSYMKSLPLSTPDDDIYHSIMDTNA